MLLNRLSGLRPKSLKQKTAIFILLPTFLIMVSIGALSLSLVRQVLLDQWQETAITKLQRSAHYVDMRLMRPKELLRFLQQKEQKNLQWVEIRLLLDQLRSLNGVVKVNHEMYIESDSTVGMRNGMGMMRGHGNHSFDLLSLSPPIYNTEIGSQTVSLFARFQNGDGKDTGYIEVFISFYDLIDQIVKSPWWKSNQAFIVDKNGNILTSTVSLNTENNSSAKKLFGQDDDLEKKTWQIMQHSNFGTVFGSGRPPDKVSGFYRLSEAPWTIVIMAPGEQVLQPILEFRKYYFLVIGLGSLAALLYIRLITEKTTRAINRLSNAAKELAQGTFSGPIAVDSRDEVGTLTTTFNVMAEQLEERLKLQEAMDIAREVQQNLLPQSGFSADGLEIAGLTIYCDETGGDYIDLLSSSREKRNATVVVGDVVGHGIGAALLMATVRALLRGRATRPGTMAEVADDVNRLLCRDTSHSGNFVTLFFLEIDRQDRYVRWVRCGHEPAIVYRPGSDTFTELRGNGIVLGFDADSSFEENSCTFSEDRQVILIGSDGVWDTENPQGERFGRERVQTLLARYHHLPAERIIRQITDQITLFRNDHPQNDDITLMIIKTW